MSYFDKTCPICNTMLQCRIEYLQGNPYIVWYCDCGYTTESYGTYMSTTTDNWFRHCYSVFKEVI